MDRQERLIIKNQSRRARQDGQIDRRCPMATRKVGPRNALHINKLQNSILHIRHTVLQHAVFQQIASTHPIGNMMPDNNLATKVICTSKIGEALLNLSTTKFKQSLAS